ncbi:MAG: hypothetical protein J6I62_04290 [Selenomonadaceae bacterium]|nr:hypothetical protein [Selenomonadaceae bacterium]
MLRQVEILKAVQDKLKKLYPLKVYLDEVKEDFETPCFFLKLIKTAIPHNIESNKCLNDCLLIIAYLALKGTAQATDLYDIKDNVTAAFWRGLQVKDRYLYFEEVSSDTDTEEAEIVYIQLPFKYYDTDFGEKEELPKIFNIHQQEKIRETKEIHCESENPGKLTKEQVLEIMRLEKESGVFNHSEEKIEQLKGELENG